MVKDHSEDLKEFKKEASEGQLAPEKEAASKGSDTVAGHLQEAQKLAQAHNVQVDEKGL